MRPEIEKAVQLLRGKGSKGLDQALALLQQTVFAFSMRVCGHREDAEDTMQEVLAKSVRHLPHFENPKALGVWLYKVAKNRCLMSRRRSKFAPWQELSLEELMPERAELDQLMKSADTPEQSLLRGEVSQRLRDAVLQVPPAYRLVLVLHDMEELSTKEVARITGLREGTVRVRLHRARLFVRKALAKKAGHPRKPEARAKGTARHGRHAAAPPARSRKCRELFAALSDYMDDELDDQLCTRLEKHLEGCTPCEAFLANLEDTVKQLSKLEADRVDTESAAALRKSLLEHNRKLLAAISERA